MTSSRAYKFTKPGSVIADILTLQDVEEPSLPPSLPLPKDVPKPEEWVKVKVSHTALNPGSQMQMCILPAFARAKECIPEMEFSGTVTDVWAPDSAIPARFAKGEQVVGFMTISHTYPTGNGALASHVVAPARYVVKMPTRASLDKSAGLLLAACTAWQQITESGIKEGNRVLVVGASGGVGTMAVQLVRSVIGPEALLVGVCSARNVDLVKSLGADHVIDYQSHSLVSTELKTRYTDEPFDAIIDCVGIQDIYLHCAQYLKSGGLYSAAAVRLGRWDLPNFLRCLVQIQLNNYWPTSSWLGGVGRAYKLVVMMDPGLSLMEKIAQFVEEGKLRLVVDSVWKPEEALKGYEILAAGRARGKILVRWD